MRWVRKSCPCYLVILAWLLQAGHALHQIQLPELNFISNNLGPDECLHLYKSLRRQASEPLNQEAYRFRGTPADCKKLLTFWLANPKDAPIDKAYDHVQLTLRQIGRPDLAHWLGHNVIRQRQLADGKKGLLLPNTKGNTPIRLKGNDHIDGGAPVKINSGGEQIAKNSSTETVLQKVMITLAVILSMTTLCLFCYKFFYTRMSGGHFNNLRKEEYDEESWLQQDRQRGGGPKSAGSANLTDTEPSLWNSVDNFKCKSVSAIEYLKKKFKVHKDDSREKRSQQLRLLIARLQKICPTQRKVINLSKKEQHLLKSVTETEKRQLPATDSDIKFLLASDREKRRLLAREGRREFLIGLRKRLERMGPDEKRNITLNETERNFIKKLSSSERVLLPIMDKDLELLVSDPLEKRQIMLKQMINKFLGISPEDRKFLELDNVEKKFLKEIDDMEKAKLGITDSELRFLVASKSQRNVMQQRLESCERDKRVEEIRKRLAEVNHDVSRLELSKSEHSSFLSLSSYELAKLGLTQEHLKYYAASDSERKVIWPSPSQHRNLRLNTLQNKLSKLPWRDCSTRLTSSEHTLLASLSPREQDKLHISDSEKNFMLSTDSEKELIQRQRKIELLEAKIRDFNTVTMTESERGLIFSLSPSELQMLNIDSTNKSSLLENKSEKSYCDTINREMTMKSLEGKIDRNGKVNLNEDERILLSTLTPLEMAAMHLSASQVDFLLSGGSRDSDQQRRMMKIDMIKDRIHCEGICEVQLTGSERELIESMTNCEINSSHLTTSQLSFLLKRKSERKMTYEEENRDHHCHQQASSSQNCHSHSHSCSTHLGHENQIICGQNQADCRNKVQFKEPNISCCKQALAKDSTDDSELSESYDELGMLFSQQMKQQARPCQRRYCLLGRHLKKGSQHDERQCQVRHHCCRGYPSDQRPSCSSGNVCKDTYHEFFLMHAAPHEKKKLTSRIYESRKQFLDQRCQRCPGTSENRMMAQ